MDKGDVLCINEDTVLICNEKGVIEHLDYEDYLILKKNEEYEQKLKEEEEEEAF
jgi:hypothetical protein